MAACGACNGTILMGGEHHQGMRFCNESCVEDYLVGFVDRHNDQFAVGEAIQGVFQAECPKCNGAGPVDLYGTTKITGMLLVFTISSPSEVCCVKCGRLLRLGGFFHCLLLGWWAPKAALYNIFVLPYNLIRTLFTFQPNEPSAKLVRSVKVNLGQSLENELRSK